MKIQTAKLESITTVDWLFWSMITLAIGGMGVSAYLMWGFTVPGASLACGGSHGCETVKNSIYANLMGIPLPVAGLASFSIILAFLALQRQFSNDKPYWLSYIALAIFGLSLTGTLYSAYLTYLEFFVIYAVCRWCITSAIIMTALFFLSVLNLRQINQLY